MAVLKARKRSEIGTRRVKPLRKGGEIPAILYGHKQATVALTVNQHDLAVALAHRERWLELDIEGQKENALLKDVQYDAMGNDILHVDLARVSLDERVKVTVPIVLRGVAAGAAEGGVVQQINATASIECAVRDIPDDIRISIAEMKVNDVLHMRDLPLAAGMKLLSDAEAIVATCSVIAEVEVAAPAEAAAAGEPEVIGAKKEEEGEGEEAAKK
ncbi:MAG: 50S ribosomal protein L25 [Phycisphaerae bacterium]|jgi:large subunit ribosomal protein L25